MFLSSFYSSNKMRDTVVLYFCDEFDLLHCFYHFICLYIFFSFLLSNYVRLTLVGKTSTVYDAKDAYFCPFLGYYCGSCLL